MQRRLRKSRAKNAEKKGARQATGKRPRDDDEGLVADVLGKKRPLEEAHQSVMGTGPRLPPFDLQAPPKLPFDMEDVYAEGVEKVDFSMLRRQKKEVNLAMHRHEVPLVNVFLEGVKCDSEAYGEMYVNEMAKEIPRLKRRNEMAKDKIRGGEAEAVEGRGGSTEAIESFRGSEELRSYIMDRMVDVQLRWEDRLARFNLSVEINFDMSAEPPSSSRTTEATPEPKLEPATTDAPSTES
ncbi:unnamed protein product [Prunus brigantina]